MAQAISSISSVSSTHGKVHTNKPVNPETIVRICSIASRIDDGRDKNNNYPAILIDIEDEGKQYWFYDLGDEATRDADYTALDLQINPPLPPISPPVYDAIVDAAGNGDYLLPSAAIAGGACTMFVRAGVYTEIVDVVLGDNCKIVGESSGVVISFDAGVGIKNTTTAVSKTGGDVSISNGDTDVVGVGTAFVGGDVGSYIKIGEGFYKIATVTDGLNLTIDRTYNGTAVANETAYFIREMIVGVTLENLNLQGGGVSDSLITFDGVLMSTVDRVLLDSASVNNLSLFESGVIHLENIISRSSTQSGIFIDESCAIKITESTSYTNTTHAYRLENSKGITIDACFGMDCGGDAVSVVGCDKILISDTQILNNNDKGISVDATSLSVIVSDCQVQNCTDIAISNFSDNAIVSNCYVKDSIAGIFASGGSSLIIGCYGENITPSTTFFTGGATGENGKIIGCRAISCSKAIRVDGDGNVVSSNTIESCTAGIDIFGGSGDNNVVIGNSIDGSTGTAISVNGSNNILEQNILLNNTTNYDLTLATSTKIDGFVYDNVQTVDATPTALTTISIPNDDTQYIYELSVTAMSTDNVDYGVWKRTIVAKRVSGVTTIDLFNLDVDSQTGLVPGSVAANVSGANVGIDVTGVANTIDWVSGYKFLNQAPIL